MCIHNDVAVTAYIQAVRQNNVCPTLSDKELKSKPLSILPKTPLRKTLVSIKNKYGYVANLRVLDKIAPLVSIGDLSAVMNEPDPLTKEVVLNFFKRVSCCRAGSCISGQDITRPHLISLVEQLEHCTGLQLTDQSNAPLAYIENACESGEIITVADIAEFFTQSDGKIREILARAAARKQAAS